MDINKTVLPLVKTMIFCHDEGDFDKLSTLMDPDMMKAEDAFITKEKFEEVSKSMRQEIGASKDVEYMGRLKKMGSIHTLWKVQYSNTDEEILWQVSLNLDEQNPKILRMSLN